MQMYFIVSLLQHGRREHTLLQNVFVNGNGYSSGLTLSAHQGYSQMCILTLTNYPLRIY